MKKKVAIQGIAGSYHDIAARNYHEGEEIEIIPCNTFRDVITTIKKDPSVPVSYTHLDVYKRQDRYDAKRE